MTAIDTRMRPETRSLDAAEALVRTHGVTDLTPEATAQCSRPSHGGLRYYFACNEALANRHLGRAADPITADCAKSVAAQAPGSGRVSRAIPEWGLSGPDDQACKHSHRAAALALLAAFYFPNLLGPVRSLFSRSQDCAESDGRAPGHGSTIIAAMDDLFLARLFGICALLPLAEALVS